MSTDRWIIHRHFAQQMNERLDFVKITPQHILLAGADNDISHSLLAQRYPKAHFVEYDSRLDFLQESAQTRGQGFFSKLTGKNIAQFCQPLHAAYPTASAQILWANLSLITERDLLTTFRAWANALQTEGMLFFSHFGHQSLQELICRLKAQGIQANAPNLVDMHDLGDMLADNGFYDPVMDTAQLCLNYQNITTFWQDMEITGLIQAFDFSNKILAYKAINQMWQAGEIHEIHLETVFGHAIKKNILPEGEREILFYPRRKNG